MEYKKKLTDFLSTCSGKVSNVFFEIYKIIDSLDQKEQPLALMFVCENIFKIDTDSSDRIEKEYYTDVQIKKAHEKNENKFLPWLSDTIMHCIAHNIPAQQFYEMAWETIQHKQFFKTKRERAIGLFTLVDHELIPYRGVGVGITLSEEEFDEIYESLVSTHLEETEYILSVPYEQKTQKASLIVKKLDLLNSEEEKAVYLSVVMNQIERNIKDKLREMFEDL